MTVRQNIIDALEGETPKRTPLTIYDWEMGAVTSTELAVAMNDPKWKRLIDMGLGVRHHCPVTKAIAHGVEQTVSEENREGVTYRKEVKTTPVGSVQKITRNGWHHEDWLKTPEDYKIQQWIVEHTELQPNYLAYEQATEVVGEHGVVVLTGSGNWQHRSPAMSINIDWAGTEQFCMDIAMEVPELFDLYEAQKKLFLQEEQLIANSPGRYMIWFENLTISMLGPQRYADLLMSAYHDAIPIVNAGGKRVFVHYDGAVNLIADQIANAPFHGIDSLTEPPEGDMTYDRCRQLWPDMVLWANINIDLYSRPADELRQAVIDKRNRAGKRGLIFEISEELPANWIESIPTVLKTLEEMD